MPEDIKILEEMLNSKEPVCNYKLKHQEIEAISNLLTRYKQLKEDNNNKSIKIIEYEKTLEKLQKETIWKSKVEEKIEELETKKKEYGFGSIESMLFLNKIQVLQELLREE